MSEGKAVLTYRKLKTALKKLTGKQLDMPVTVYDPEFETVHQVALGINTESVVFGHVLDVETLEPGTPLVVLDWVDCLPTNIDDLFEKEMDDERGASDSSISDESLIGLRTGSD